MWYRIRRLQVQFLSGAPRFEVAPRRVKMKGLTGQKHGFSLRDVVPVLQLNLDAHTHNQH